MSEIIPLDIEQSVVEPIQVDLDKLPERKEQHFGENPVQVKSRKAREGAFVVEDEEEEELLQDIHEKDVPFKCPSCRIVVEPGEADPCMGSLPGVKLACCGHGSGQGYIMFENGASLVFQGPLIRVNVDPKEQESESEPVVE
jgi:hypothetical protein